MGGGRGRGSGVVHQGYSFFMKKPRLQFRFWQGEIWNMFEVQRVRLFKNLAGRLQPRLGHPNPSLTLSLNE